MPQLVLFAIASVGVLIARKLYQLERDRIARALRAEQELAAKRSDAPRVTLVRDPQTGIYRPNRNRVGR